MKKRIAIFIILIIAIVFIIGVRTEPGRVIYGTDNTVTISKNEYERLVRNNEALKKYLLLEEAREFVEQNYYKEPDNQAMMDGAIQGLLQGLGDAYTFYYPKEAWKTLWEEDEGKYAGIGVQMLGNWRDSTVTIIRVFKDTPAEKVGLRKGDVFYKVEDIEVTTATMQDAVNTMRGTPGEKVKIEIIRNGETIPFELTKAEILVNRMEYTMLENNIGYIAIYEFAGEVDMEFRKAFEELQSKNAKGLIVDLRDNPGGWVEQGRRIADMFLDRGLLFYTEDRQGKKESSFTMDGKSNIPLVLLVNENSASTSEILSGAMKDYGRAKLVGTNTFGKGVIQNVVPLSDGVSGMQFTVAQYFTPKGNKVHETGIAPDVEIKLPKGDENKYFQFGNMEDPQLKKAYEVLLGEMN
ncbi:MAG TPA: S41 family peptidase [Christensenellaceae bacterium]|jgi:carboxyl-terminal processing protease|nr:S41 family peptidase [Christensenellaceae bacterium]